MPRHPVLVLALIAAVGGCAEAQKKTANAEAAKPPVEKTAAELEAERVVRERRANVQSLLVGLAADARNFSDARVRARTQARIADMLWETDYQRSRNMFRSAFDAAEVADAESQEKIEEDIRQQQARNPNGGYGYASPPEIRREVLGIASRRDTKLGEELLERYSDQKSAQVRDQPNHRPDLRGSDQTAQRYDLAKELLSEGDSQRALQYADPALSSINIASVDFLARLRVKDAAAADQRYAVMLQSAAMNPMSDANTASLLASYIFSPSIYVTFLGYGSASTESGGSRNPPNISPDLRAAFFRTAAAILLRPLPEQSLAGPDGQYLGLRRLMPLFERFAPPAMSAALQAQLESLGAAASDAARARDDVWMHRGIDPPAADTPARAETQVTSGQPADRQGPGPEQTLLDKVDRAQTPAARDQLYLQLAMMMIDKDDQRAHEYIEKINDSDLRNTTRAYIDACIAYRLGESRNVDQALEFAKTGDLTHFQRAWLLSQTASQIGLKDHDRALPVLDEAIAEARLIEIGDPDRPRAFFGIANVVLRVNHTAVWETVGDAITAANSANGFTGEDGKIAFGLVTHGVNSGHEHSIRDFDVAGIFTRLAGEDYDKAVTLARNFQDGAPRANAVIAIARLVLGEPKK